VDKDHFEISVLGDGFDSFDTLESYFKRRATELCGGRSHTEVIDREYLKRPSVSPGSSVKWPIVRGMAACATPN